jgi:acyl-CoA synthetase (AMP-forming)/AMP-acid ligase II
MTMPPPATIAAVLRAAAVRFGDRPAYWTGSSPREHLTYREVYATACKFAQHLTRNGMARGERVCIYAPNRHEWSLAFWGAVLAGGVAVPIDPNSGPVEINHTLHDTGARWIVTTAKLLPQLAGFRDKNIIVIDGGGGEGCTALAAILATQPDRDPGVEAASGDPDRKSVV